MRISILVNALGQQLFVREFTNQINIDVSAYQRGIHFLHVEEKSGGMKTVKKIVLQ